MTRGIMAVGATWLVLAAAWIIITYGAKRGWQWCATQHPLGRGGFVLRYGIPIVGEYLAAILANIAKTEGAPVLLGAAALLFLAATVREAALGMRRLDNAGYPGRYFYPLAAVAALLRLFFPLDWSTWLVFIVLFMFPSAARR